MDSSSLDDTKLLMQYFRKHDTDKNHKLDGLELLKAIAGMEEDHHHDDEDDDDSDEHLPRDGPLKVDLEQIIPIVDSILAQDDKVGALKAIEVSVVIFRGSCMICIISEQGWLPQLCRVHVETEAAHQILAHSAVAVEATLSTM